MWVALSSLSLCHPLARPPARLRQSVHCIPLFFFLLPSLASYVLHLCSKVAEGKRRDEEEEEEEAAAA